jgi:hypothetical protein
LLIERRGQDVDLFKGFYHVVGGYTEIEADLGPDGIPNFSGAILREMAEELGGVAPVAGSLRFTGLAYDCVYHHPELCFAALLSESLEDIRGMAKTTAEFHDVIRVGSGADALMEFMACEASRIVPTGKASLLLYGKLRFGAPWFDPAARIFSAR